LRSQPRPPLEAAILSDDLYALASTSLPASPRKTGTGASQAPSLGGGTFSQCGAGASPIRPQRQLSKKLPWFRRNRLLVLLGSAAGALLLVGLFAFVYRLWNSSATPNGQSASQQPNQPDQAHIGTGVPKAIGAAATRPPRLARIANQTVDSGRVLQLTVRLVDPGTSAGKLRFGLAAGAPPGATVDPLRGVFAWMPTKDVAPGVYPITVCVLADGMGNLGDQASFCVTVRKIARPPVIYIAGQRPVAPGHKVQFPIRATNPDGTISDLSFSLADAPPWVSIDAATGMVTCEPDQTQPPGQYSVTVRVASGTMEEMQNEKIFTVVVASASVPIALRPTSTRTGHSSQKVQFWDSRATTQPFQIKLPSGNVLTTEDVDVRDVVRRAIDSLLEKSGVSTVARHPDGLAAIRLYQQGSHFAVTSLSGVRGTTLQGPTVVLYPCAQYRRATPKQYISYKNGRWNGLLTTWNAENQKEFWCNYSNGQRQGLCCLFDKDAVTAILECTRNTIDSVHLVTANHVTKSFASADEARADDSAGAVLKQIDTIEQSLKEDDRSLRGRVTEEVNSLRAQARKELNLRAGAVHKEQREASGERAAARAKARDQTIQGLRQAGGL